MRALLALPVAVLAAAAGPPPAPSPEAVAAVFRKSPDFAGQPGRTFTRVVRVIDIGDGDVDAIWVAEVAWQEGGRSVIGRGIVAVDDGREGPAPGRKMFFRADGWMLPHPLLVGPPADELLAGLQRARLGANEAMNKADLRTLKTEQSIHAETNDGRYADPTTLSLKAQVLQPTRAGYRREFRLGRDAKSFVFFASPLEPGVTGREAYCVDGERQLCASAVTTEPDFTAGRCPSPCRPVD